MKFSERLIRRLKLIEPNEKLIRVKSWWPSYDPHGPAWPLMLVDRRDGRRWTIVPIWDWERVRLLLGYPERPSGPFDTGAM